MRRIVVRAGGPFAARSTVSGAKNSVLKCMAATLLAPGRHVITNVAAIEDVTVMGDVLDRDGRRRRPRRGSPPSRRSCSTCPRSASPRRPTSWPNRSARRSSCSVRCWRASVGPRCRCPAATTSARGPIDMHIKGFEALGANIDDAPRRPRGDRRPAARRPHRARLPERRRHREPADGRGAGQGHDRDRQRGARARDRRPRRRCSPRWARASTARTPRRSPSRASTRCEPTEHVVIPDRIEAATYATAVGLAGGGVTIQRRAASTTWTCSPRSSARWACTCRPSTAASGSTSEGRTTVGRRVRRCRIPGIATDYKPFLLTLLTVSDGVAHRHRERLRRQPLRVRRRVDPHGRRHPHRGPPRRRAGRAPALAARPIKAHDIRAGAALVLAGLAADGNTRCSRRPSRRAGLRRPRRFAESPRC